MTQITLIGLLGKEGGAEPASKPFLRPLDQDERQDPQLTPTSAAERPPRIDIRQVRWARIGIPLFVTYFICFMDRTNISVASPHLAENCS